MRTSDVAAATGGRLVGPDVTVAGLAIDSRLVTGGELFVPLVAERDGHDFVAAALDAGAAAYLTARPPLDRRSGSAVEVADTSEALAALGRHARGLLDARVDGRVVGVTGSVGKTSVKDLLAAALAARWRTAASAGSFNNELGVPLTLANAPAGTEALVVEMGARGAGHISDLCAIARPTVGVVTRVAAVHTATFGTLEAVAAAKGELVAALPSSGSAVLNAADPLVAAMAGRTSARVVTFGAGGDVRAGKVVLDEDLRPEVHLITPWGDTAVRLAARGAHMVENALAAATAALVCDVPLGDIAGALATADVSRWRMELRTLPAGARLLNDAYNANPTSMAAALRALAALDATRRVAVLGLMAELGAGSDAEHRAVGDLARELGIEVVAVGVPAYGGTLVADLDEAAAALDGLGPGDAVLLKGSRVVGLERLAERLR
ncbi:MAG TPA: UDP-N-acetylmuramoyl-tripeptide--D-alanyl-D-alanine ligase [Acidimicrobiales bacterium]|nr:UDP-N-acetylmuramoyl-tripeptide--D-alanyl-D-alanine ligase [Acidimicrobiales bacterium]